MSKINKKKILNDPVYGFISIPYEIIFDLIQHPYFQRLRRIKQLGLTDLIYPGANHSRFHHALGAMHLTTLAINVLRSKGIEISEDESEAVSIAILLHDLGHGPFSHALEGVLVHCSHEALSLALMHRLNDEFMGSLTLAIDIFTGRYHKRFLHQLVSGQLDMDRIDYLNRDSFYSGVLEGKIGYDRIIKMLQVVDDQLVVEEKGIYSIEKFLIARKIMYWQVYLHKTVLAAELMLTHAIRRALHLTITEVVTPGMGEQIQALTRLDWDTLGDREIILDNFTQIDDHDIAILLKKSFLCGDYILYTLAQGLILRKLFRLELRPNPFPSDYLDNVRLKVAKSMNIDIETTEKLIWTGSENTETYNTQDDEIKILMKQGSIRNLSSFDEYKSIIHHITKHYMCYPKH
ncbi:MAG: HD domain-containing protein [Saprospiraceae bacterium]|nr:HD domain-containing protein [Saprospiraceae bacterium]